MVLGMAVYSSELVDFLQKDTKIPHVVVMPDFFIDRLITIEYNIQELSNRIVDKIERKGGSIDQVPQIDQRGGNAANVASALAALEARVTPIISTSPYGLEQVRYHLRDYKINYSHMKIGKKASMTTALEFKSANVMLRDVGTLANFGPVDLNESDYSLMENADYVCIFNWAGTRKYGTKLAESVFSHVKTKGKGKTYFDTADPMSNNEKMPELLEEVLKSSNIDILGLNENEAFSYASLLSNEIINQRSKLGFNELALESARVLANNLRTRIDLHTTTFSATVTPTKEVIVPTFKIVPLRATGAGDSWTAGNIIGDANKLSDEDRLSLANAVAAFYLSDPEGRHPTPRMLLSFLQNTLS
jgi:sugar/nucleoside kinase (ribokinase family)